MPLPTMYNQQPSGQSSLYQQLQGRLGTNLQRGGMNLARGEQRLSGAVEQLRANNSPQNQQQRRDWIRQNVLGMSPRQAAGAALGSVNDTSPPRMEPTLQYTQPAGPAPMAATTGMNYGGLPGRFPASTGPVPMSGAANNGMPSGLVPPYPTAGPAPAFSASPGLLSQLLLGNNTARTVAGIEPQQSYPIQNASQPTSEDSQWANSALQEIAMQEGRTPRSVTGMMAATANAYQMGDHPSQRGLLRQRSMAETLQNAAQQQAMGRSTAGWQSPGGMDRGARLIALASQQQQVENSTPPGLPILGMGDNVQPADLTPGNYYPVDSSRNQTNVRNPVGLGIQMTADGRAQLAPRSGWSRPADQDQRVAALQQQIQDRRDEMQLRRQARYNTEIGREARGVLADRGEEREARQAGYGSVADQLLQQRQQQEQQLQAEREQALQVAGMAPDQVAQQQAHELALATLQEQMRSAQSRQEALARGLEANPESIPAQQAFYNQLGINFDADAAQQQQQAQQEQALRANLILNGGSPAQLPFILGGETAMGAVSPGTELQGLTASQRGSAEGQAMVESVARTVLDQLPRGATPQQRMQALLDAGLYPREAEEYGGRRTMGEFLTGYSSYSPTPNSQVKPERRRRTSRN